MADEQLYGIEEEQKLYGVNAGQLPTTFREKLSKLFKASDFVRVMNIDSAPFTWQALDPSDEDYNIVPGPQKTTIRKLPKLFTIKSGQSMVLEGWNAYIMIENLYKKVAAQDRIAKKSSAQQADPKYVTAFVWSDEDQQSSYIDRIFVGQEQPTFAGAMATSHAEADYKLPQTKEADEVLKGEQYKATESVSDLAKDLGLNEASDEA
jgi:hypothetical protein